MLRAVGFSEEDFGKPQVAVASSWNEVTPCNYHLDKLAALAKEGVRQGDAVPVEFTTIAVSDGIAMGHEGMKAVADEPRPDRRFGRAGDARGAVRRAGGHRGLRQVRARHVDGDGPAEPAAGLPVRRHDPSGHLPGQRHHDPGRVRGRRRATRRARSTTPNSSGSSAPPAPRPARAPGCTPRTRWRPSARRSGCRCPAAHRRPRSTTGGRCSRARAGSGPPSSCSKVARVRATS